MFEKGKTMIGSRSMSIKRKIVVGITFAVIASTSLVDAITAKSVPRCIGTPSGRY
ncbi:exported protein of unknown function [Vibrio tapetis subsp. tapetis]|uniref:Uncharacterized protein n=1 Tax=Vibrio tapetis subsp. tapetis TaxID=1671868 RepID=A0A2N8ZKK1_9VIBR|nr:exported protein of unknown function [Vibrio tapetis subsp. tapetis]